MITYDASVDRGLKELEAHISSQAGDRLFRYVPSDPSTLYDHDISENFWFGPSGQSAYALIFTHVVLRGIETPLAYGSLAHRNMLLAAEFLYGEKKCVFVLQNIRVRDGETLRFSDNFIWTVKSRFDKNFKPLNVIQTP